MTATLIEDKIFTRMRVYMKQDHISKRIRNLKKSGCWRPPSLKKKHSQEWEYTWSKSLYAKESEIRIREAVDGHPYWRTKIYESRYIQIQKNLKCKKRLPLSATLNEGHTFMKMDVFMKKEHIYKNGWNAK